MSTGTVSKKKKKEEEDEEGEEKKKEQGVCEVRGKGKSEGKKKRKEEIEGGLFTMHFENKYRLQE